MIQPSSFTYAILAMAIITFTVRYVFFVQMVEIKLHPKIKLLLTFTAPCILTAMFIPIMFQEVITSAKTTSLLVSFQSLFMSSYFWASMITIMLSLMIRNTLTVILLGMTVFYVLRYFLG